MIHHSGYGKAQRSTGSRLTHLSYRVPRLVQRFTSRISRRALLHSLSFPVGCVLTAISPLTPCGSESKSTNYRSLRDTSLTTTHSKHTRRCPRKHHCSHHDCDKSFRDKRDLQRHVDNVHAMQVEEFECPIGGCGKTFKRKDNMRKHVRLKHPEQVYLIG